MKATAFQKGLIKYNMDELGVLTPLGVGCVRCDGRVQIRVPEGIHRVSVDRISRRGRSGKCLKMNLRLETDEKESWGRRDTFSVTEVRPGYHRALIPVSSFFEGTPRFTSYVCNIE